MKLTTLLLTLSILQVSAAGFGQSLTLKERQVSLSRVFDEIRTQTGYDVFYLPKLIKTSKKIDVDFEKASLDQVLEICLKGQPLSYAINEKSIVITQKEPSLLDKVTSLFTDIDARGRVVDTDGQPLPGATVKLKDGSRAATTSANGEFLLRGIDENAVLQISFIGYLTKEVNAATDLGNIVLEVSNSKLDEVQVIGYGVTTQRFNTGTVETVRADEIAKQPVNSPLQALQGRVPGMIVTQQTGVAGGSFNVQIRGRSSIDFNVKNNPLYIVDGVPYTSTLLPSLGSFILGGENAGGTVGNPLNFINPSDIESIDVLKDADATTIYGSRGANGVILITTKKGKSGKAALNIGFTTGMGKVANMRDLMDTRQYLDMRREAFKNDGATPNAGNAPDLLVWDTTRYTNWQKELFGGTSAYNNLQTTLSGGSENFQYLIGGTFHKETTVFPGDFADKKGSMNFNISSQSNNRRFKTTLSGNYLVDNNNLFGSNLVQTFAALAPDAPALYQADGSLNWENSTWENPLAYTKRPFKSNSNNLISNLMMDYAILPGLNIKSSFGYTNLQINQSLQSPLSSRDPATWAIYQRSTDFTNNSINSWIIEPQLNYTKSIGSGVLRVLVGSSNQQVNSDGLSLTGDGFSSDELMGDLKSATTIRVNSTTLSTYKYQAVFARLNYNLLDKYVVNLSARRDGSSRFGPGKQFNNFAALGAAWIFSQEQPVKDALPALSFGKLRFSYGTTGNDQIGEYRFLDLYNSTSNTYQGNPGLNVTSLFNPDLAWEETRKLDLGLELGFFKDKLLLNTTYYRNRSSNQLTESVLPLITGFPSILENRQALVQNSGIEASVSSVNFRSQNFSWSTALNLTIPKNKLLEFPGLETSAYNQLLEIGKPVTVVALYPYSGVNPTTGSWQFVDSSGNPTSFPDGTTLVNIEPKFYGGLSNTFSYKGLQLDLFFHFNKQKNLVRLLNNAPGTNGVNQPTLVLSRWQMPNDQTDIQKFSQARSARTATSYLINSDFMYRDVSFLRLKNASLSWQLPQSWQKSLHMEGGRLFVQGQNLLTFTKYKDGYDPETPSNLLLPPLRTIAVGFNLTF